jgi:hypothetical protein
MTQEYVMIEQERNPIHNFAHFAKHQSLMKMLTA